MFAKNLRVIAAIFVAMAFLCSSPAAANSGVDVSDHTCEVRSVEWLVSPGAQTRIIAGIYQGEVNGQCYAIVINRTEGNRAEGTITWGPTGNHGGWTRTFRATFVGKKASFAADGVQPFSGQPSNYTFTIYGSGKLRVDYQHLPFSGRWVGTEYHSKVTPYVGDTQ